MPYDSWNRLHFGDGAHARSAFACPVCRQERKVSVHARKLFLVAERLCWDETVASRQDRDQNEALNWAVNYELGILDPFVEDAEQMPGGRHSRNNQFYPYQNEHEMKLAAKLIWMTEDMTPATWALWINSQLGLEKMGMEAPPKRIVSYKTMQDFYSLLDQIERTSYVGARFLEAYAERLRDDMCKDCWFRQHVRMDLF
ncbi:hypothetical protein ACEQ8H_003579 [Pleosporales sp. CAS-2024a]